MQLFKDFGFEPTFFVAQIINFLILAFVFKKFLYKPVLSVLKKRQKQIAQGIEDAQKAAEELEKANEKHDKILKDASAEADKILAEAKADAESTRDKILSDAHANAEKIIAEARITGAAEREKMLSEAKDAAVMISRKMLERIVDDLFTKEEKEKIIARDIKKLENI